MYLNTVISKNFDKLGRLLERLGFSGVYHFEAMSRRTWSAEIVRHDYLDCWTIKFSNGDKAT